MKKAMPILFVLALLALASTALADNLSFSVITSTGTKPISGMASYKLAETDNGNLSAWADLLYMGSEDSLALGLSGRSKQLDLPLVKGAGFCAYWSFRHECIKGRFYIINVTF